MEHAGFPSDETLAAFIDGTLDASSRARVMEHMTACDECYAAFAGISELRASDDAGDFPRMDSHRGWTSWARAARYGAFAAAVAAAVLVVLLLPVFHRRSPVLSLAAATASSPRTIEARLSSFPYSPLAPTMRGSGEKVPQNWKLLAAAAEIQEETARRPTPENLQALGIAHLLTGKFDEAIPLLERVAASPEGSVDERSSRLNDLAAAYIARGRWTGNAADFAAASRVSAQAWSLAHKPEIAFNRALIAESLAADATAKRKWEQYLAMDGRSGWAGEARGRVGR